MFQAPNSYLENIIFDIYETSYDNDLNNEVINSSASVSGIRGHIQDTFLQASPDGGSLERERTATMRLVVHLTEDNVDYITNGNIVVVTHRKNRRTKSWNAVSSEQYIINFDVDVMPHGNYRILSLITKDKL